MIQRLTPAMADTEAIFRTVLRRLLENSDMLRTFLSKDRDKFLEEWVFSRHTDPPPYPLKIRNLDSAGFELAVLSSHLFRSSALRGPSQTRQSRLVNPSRVSINSSSS